MNRLSVIAEDFRKKRAIDRKLKKEGTAGRGLLEHGRAVHRTAGALDQAVEAGQSRVDKKQIAVDTFLELMHTELARSALENELPENPYPFIEEQILITAEAIHERELAWPTEDIVQDIRNSVLNGPDQELFKTIWARAYAKRLDEIISVNKELHPELKTRAELDTFLENILAEGETAHIPEDVVTGKLEEERKKWEAWYTNPDRLWNELEHSILSADGHEVDLERLKAIADEPFILDFLTKATEIMPIVEHAGSNILEHAWRELMQQIIVDRFSSIKDTYDENLRISIEAQQEMAKKKAEFKNLEMLAQAGGVDMRSARRIYDQEMGALKAKVKSAQKILGAYEKMLNRNPEKLRRALQETYQMYDPEQGMEKTQKLWDTFIAGIDEEEGSTKRKRQFGQIPQSQLSPFVKKWNKKEREFLDSFANQTANRQKGKS